MADSLSRDLVFINFCNFSLSGNKPDAITIGRFRAKLITSTSASGIQTHKYYDDYQNLIHLSQGNTHHYYQYDNANRLTQTTDALGNISTQDYDNFGNIISTTQALGTSAEVTTHFRYDNSHNLTYNNGDRTYCAYNALNQMISNKETTYTYDTNGNLATLTQPNGTQISYTYDSLNRKTQTKVNDTLAQTFNYDKLSRMTRATDYNPQQQDSNIQQKTNTITYRYNALSQVTNETQNGKSVSVSYNNNQNPTRIRYNAQLAINKSYNRLSTIEYQNNNIVNFNYNADKQIQSQTLANELTASFNYDNNARLIEKNYNNLFTQEIDYDNNNNIIQEQVNLGATQQIKSYTCDAQDRLTKDNFLAQYFTYDAISNLTTTNQNNQAESRQTNANNEYTNITYTNPSTNTQTPVNISYNSNGNLSTYQNKTYTYDYLNRLINIKNNINQPIASYTYDAQNRRVSKTVYTPTNNNNTTTNTTTYLYNQNQVIAQYQNTNTQPSVSFIYSDNTDEPMALIKDQKIYYYLKNHLGSIIVLTDNTRLLEIYEYNAFGKLTIKDHNQNIIPKSNYNNPYTYTGRRFDNERGLYYYRNRYYQPSLARFISQDPKGYIDGYNLYAYAKNSPLKYTDPFGTTAQQTNYDYQEEWNNWDNDDNWDNFGDTSYWDDGDDNNGNSQNNFNSTHATGRDNSSNSQNNLDITPATTKNQLNVTSKFNEYNLCGQCHGADYSNREFSASADQELAYTTRLLVVTAAVSLIPGLNEVMYTKTAIQLGRMANTLKSSVLAKTAVSVKKIGDSATIFRHSATLKIQSVSRKVRGSYYKNANHVEGFMDFTTSSFPGIPAISGSGAIGAINGFLNSPEELFR